MSQRNDRTDPRLRRRGFAVVLALTLLVMIQLIVVAKPGNTPPPQDPGEGSCDVDGVDVVWNAGFFSNEGRATVSHATVRGIAPTCENAILKVVLLDGEEELGDSQMVSTGSSSMTVGFDPRVDAEAVDNVYVELAGGTTPIPQQCRSLKLDRITIGTNSDDVIDGFQLANLVYGLDGADTITGNQQDDCLDGQGGADTVRGGPGKDVLLGGDGVDRLYGDQGNDLLYGGPGNDALEGGAGNDTLDGGPGDHDVCVLETKQDKAINCEVLIK